MGFSAKNTTMIYRIVDWGYDYEKALELYETCNSVAINIVKNHMGDQEYIGSIMLSREYMIELHNAIKLYLETTENKSNGTTEEEQC